MKRLLLLLLSLLFITAPCLQAQDDNPYAQFGHEGKVLKTPQERQQFMLKIPNPDVTSEIALIGIAPNEGKYYLFDAANEVIEEDTLMDDEVARFLSVDPLTRSYPMLTPYQFGSNRPIDGIDLDGLEHAYAADGTYIGKLGELNTVVVYSYADVETQVCTVDELGCTETVTTQNVRSPDFYTLTDEEGNSVDHDVFIETASVAYGESSVGYNIVSYEEMNGIAYVYINKNKVAYAKKKEAAKKFRAGTPEQRDKTAAKRTAISATIGAYNEEDSSGGASAWDGLDQAIVKGTKMKVGGIISHAYTGGWTMNKIHFEDWKKAVKEAGKKFRAKRNDAGEWSYNKGLYRYKSTAQHGASIFWKERKPADSKQTIDQEMQSMPQPKGLKQ